MRSARFATAVVFLVSLATILGAWGFELIGGLPPCPLCLEQRWAYYAVIPISAVALWRLRGEDRDAPARLGLALCGVIMLAGAGLALYHAGIEWGWWPGPTECSGADMLRGRTSVLPNLSATSVVRCDEAPWRLLGLSLAGYNVLISLGLAGLSLGAVVQFRGQSQRC